MNPRLLAIIRKELLHILRDRRTLAVMILIPVVQLFLLGYALSLVALIYFLAAYFLQVRQVRNGIELISRFIPGASRVFDGPSLWRIEAAEDLGLGPGELIAAMSPGPAFPAVLRTVEAAFRVRPLAQ